MVRRLCSGLQLTQNLNCNNTSNVAVVVVVVVAVEVVVAARLANNIIISILMNSIFMNLCCLFQSAHHVYSF